MNPKWRIPPTLTYPGMAAVSDLVVPMGASTGSLKRSTTPRLLSHALGRRGSVDSMAGSIQHRSDRPKPWRARYWGPDGRQHSRSFERKINAERWLRAELSRLDHGEWLDPSAGARLFSDWAEVWLAGKAAVTEKTWDGYESILRSRVLPTFGQVPVGKVTRDAVGRWIADLKADGLSPSRIRNCYNVLAACMDAAVDEGLIGRNPARRVELPRQRPYDHRYLTARQVDRLAAAFPSDADRALVVVLAYGGLRFGEAVALRRARVDILRRRLEIAEAATEVAGRLVFGEPKTHRRRFVQLPRFVAETLARHLADRPSGSDTLVWSAPNGGPLRYGNFRSRVWKPIVRRAGPDLEGITLHALRHTTASLMRAAGADVKEIQQQLGHLSPVVTLSVYTHLFEGALDPVMERLDDEHRSLAWPSRDPNVTELGHRQRKKGG